MRVSVVVCEHSMDRYDDFREAVESLFAQTYDDTEVVLVSDGNETVCERLREDYGGETAGGEAAGREAAGVEGGGVEADGGDGDSEADGGETDVVVHCLDENLGLLGARNAGAEVASGDVVAFIDDDAVADEEWVAELVEVYESRDVPAVGGKMTPAWVAGRPGFLPEEFYWLVGVTHRGFADGPGEVRNTSGSNLSFRRDVFLDLDGFDTDIGGRKGDANLQGGETELCARLQAEYGHGVYYNPRAEVAHKVFDYRTEFSWLLDRAFWQGYSKRAMEVLVPGSTGEESAFLGALLTEFVPARVKRLLLGPSVEKAAQLLALVVFTAAVGFGYLYGMYKWG